MLRLAGGSAARCGANLSRGAGPRSRRSGAAGRRDSGSRLVAAPRRSAAAPASARAERLIVGIDPAARAARDGLATLTAGAPRRRGAPLDSRWGLAALDRGRRGGDRRDPGRHARPQPGAGGRPVAGPARRAASRPRRRAGARRRRRRRRPPEFAAAVQRRRARRAATARWSRHCDGLRRPGRDSSTRAPSDLTPREACARRRPERSTRATRRCTTRGSACPTRCGSTGLLRAVPPSGHVAGIYARGDLAIGVHKPPANERARGRQRDVPSIVDDVAPRRPERRRRQRHPAATAAAASASLGARTLSADDRRWRYVNVRRLLTDDRGGDRRADRSGRSSSRTTPDAVARGRPRRRAASSTACGSAGCSTAPRRTRPTPVRCDETTNPPEEIDAGRMICRRSASSRRGRPSSSIVRIGTTAARHRDRGEREAPRCLSTGARARPVPRLPLRGHARRPGRRRASASAAACSSRPRCRTTPRAGCNTHVLHVPDAHQADATSRSSAASSTARCGTGTPTLVRGRIQLPQRHRSSCATRPASEVVAEWQFRERFPVQVDRARAERQPEHVAVETFELCHQGLERRTD